METNRPVLQPLTHYHTNLTLIDCLIFNNVLNLISAISRPPVHLSMISLSYGTVPYYSAQHSFQATGCFPSQPSSKIKVTSGRQMSPVAMIFISLKEIGQAGN